ncbi:MAG: hypothetical protein LC687_07465, partial [Actinobacteria bacterium]|nr:hypothetical protein [Actinomycetota bacterium]
MLDVNDVETLQTSLSAGSIVFSDGTNLAEDNANFFWDDANNRLGIGTTTPSAILEIVGDGSTPYLRIGSGNGNYALEVDENDKVSVGTGNDHIYLNTSGGTNVGVGTSSPISDFTVVGDSYFQGDVEVTGTTSVNTLTVGSDTITDITGDGLSVVSQTGGGLGLNVNDIETLTTGLGAGSIIFSDGTNLTQDSDNFFWDDANNRLGIGTSTPATTLDVQGRIRSEANHTGSGNARGIDSTIQSSPGSTFSRLVGISAGSYNNSEVNNTASYQGVVGVDISAGSYAGTSTVIGTDNMVDIYGSTVPNLYGIKTHNQFSNGGGGSVGNSYGIYVSHYLSGDDVENHYQLYLAESGRTGVTGDYFGVYQEDVDADNYFAGNVGIGTDSPDSLAHLYDITGDAQMRIEAGDGSSSNLRLTEYNSGGVEYGSFIRNSGASNILEIGTVDADTDY